MTDTNKLRDALIESRRIVADALEAFGDCDHSVGICNCDMKRSLEQSDEALAASKPEPQAQAEELEVVAYIQTSKDGSDLIWEWDYDEELDGPLYSYEPLITLQSHHEVMVNRDMEHFFMTESHCEAMATAMQMMSEQDYEYNRKTNALIERHNKAIAKKDEALKACVGARADLEEQLQQWIGLYESACQAVKENQAALQTCIKALQYAKVWHSVKLHKAFVKPQCVAAITQAEGAMK